MKKGKLFALLSMMSFAAIGVGVVGTFAWYTIGAAANRGIADQASLMTVPNAATGIADGYVTFDVTWTEDATYNSEHIHFVNDDGYEYVWQNGSLIRANSAEGTYAYGKMTVQLGNALSVMDSVNYDSTNYADLSADEKAAIAGTYTLQIGGTSNRVHLYSSEPTEHFASNDDTITVSVTLGKTSAAPTANAAVTFYYTLAGYSQANNMEVQDNNPIRFSFSLTHVSYTPVVA